MKKKLNPNALCLCESCHGEYARREMVNEACCSDCAAEGVNEAVPPALPRALSGSEDFVSFTDEDDDDFAGVDADDEDDVVFTGLSGDEDFVAIENRQHPRNRPFMNRLNEAFESRSFRPGLRAEAYFTPGDEGIAAAREEAGLSPFGNPGEDGMWAAQQGLEVYGPRETYDDGPLFSNDADFDDDFAGTETATCAECGEDPSTCQCHDGPVLTEEGTNFDKFMDSVLINETRRTVKREIPDNGARRYNARYGELAHNRMRVTKRVK
jgi:hypothetical protein